MKSLKVILSMISILTSAFCWAENSKLDQEFRGLGDNPEVIERVRQLDNEQKVRIVQNRLVNRNNRIELGVDYGYLSGADSYVRTQNLGALIQYHINPKWSVGFDYQKSENELTPEGTRIYDAAYACQQADAGCTKRFPGVDYPLETKLVTVNYYPIYGKLNLFDSSVAQFDLYTLLGYGQKTLSSGSSDVYAVGVGSGLWVNSFVTTRLEIRYETYKDLAKTDHRSQSDVIAQASLGILVW